MAVIARGTIADRPWGRTFAFVASRAFSGDLVLVEGGKRYVVGWRNGAVVAASSPLAADAVARIAMTAQLINSSQVGDIMRALAAAPGRDEVDVIAEAVKLTPELAVRLRRRAVAARAMRTFALAAGEFTLDDDGQLPHHPELAIDARAITFAGARAHFSDARLLEELAGLGLVFRLRDEAVAELGQYGFGEEERAALQYLRERSASPDQLEQAFPDAEAKGLRAMLYALACFAATAGSGTASPRASTPSQPPPRASTPSTAPPPRASTPSTAPPPRASTPSTAPPPRASTPSTAPPPRASTPSTAPPPRASALTTPPSRPATVPPPVTAPPPSQAQTATGDWSEASSPAIRRTRAKIRSSAPPAATGHAEADAIRSLVAERLALLDRGADHFALLGISADATPDEIRTAYFGLARQLHPDRLAAVGVADERREAQRLFAQINNAFGVLSNPKRRAEYAGVMREGGTEVVRAKEVEAEQMAARLFGAEEHFRRGEMALRRDQIDAALAEFKQAYELNPAEGEHHALYAWTIYLTTPDKAKVRAQVRKMMDEAIRLAPRSATAALYLGRMARLEGHDDQAMEHFNRVMQLMPGHSEAASELRVLEARKSSRPNKPTKSPDDKPKGGLFGFIKKS